MVLIDSSRAVDRTRMRAAYRPWRGAVLPASLGLLAAVIAAVSATIPSVWYDEAATVTSATRSWPELWRELAHVDIVHGLYYAGMHVWFDLVGYTPFTLRLPSVIAVGLSAALLVVLLRAASGPRVAVAAGLVLPFLPRVAWAGGEGRSYALGILGAIATTAALWIALRTGRKRWWPVYGLFAALSTLLFLYLALVLVAHAATVAWLALARRIDRRDVLSFLATAAAVAVVSAPLALRARRQDAQLDWIPALGDHTPRFVLAGQWFGGSWPVAVGLGALAVAGVVVLIVRRSSLAAWVIPALVLPTAVLLVATAVYAPLYSPRYLTFVTPAVAIAIGAAIAALPTRPVRVLALVAVVALSVPLLVTKVWTPMAKQNSTWAQVAAFIGERRAADPAPTAILWGPVRYHTKATARVIEYTYPDAFEGTIDPTLEIPAAESGRLWEYRGKLVDNLGDVQSADTAYLVTSVKRDWIPSYTATLAGIGWEPVGHWTFGDVNVVQFSPEP